MVKKIQQLSCSVSFMLTLTWGSQIIWNVKTINRGRIWKAPFVLCLIGLGFHAKLAFFWYHWWWSASWCLDYRSLLGLSKYGSDSWRRYNVKGVCWCVDGDLTWGVSLAGQVNRLGIGENYVCYLVIVVIFMGLGCYCMRCYSIRITYFGFFWCKNSSMIYTT